MMEQIIALVIFIGCYSLALTRKVKIAYVSLAAAGLLILLGVATPQWAFFSAINWDVLGIYWGFMMLSMIFTESGIPAHIAHTIVRKAKSEKFAIFYLCAITVLLSAFMENVGAVLMVAPIAIELAKDTKSDLFKYMVAVAISANAVTTVTMISDPPSLIMALETGMRFFDFYWFQNRISLGVITVFSVVAALFSLLFIFRGLNKAVKMKERKTCIRYPPLIIFVAGIVALAAGPYVGISPGLIGLAVGVVSLAEGRGKKAKMMKDFDWNSFFFIAGIFVVIGSLELTGLLGSFTNWIGGMGISSPALILALIIWLSVAASSFMDNVPYTMLMIPVCTQLGTMLNINPFVLLFGMLIGTGIGGNITPVGATANVFACGIAEKHGCKVRFKEYIKISLPFSVIAVLVAHILLQLLWL